MLYNFTIRRAFNQLKVVLYVDCDKKDAEIVLTYNRRVRHVGPVEYWLVETPEKAEQYLSRDSITYPERGSMIEALEAQYRLGFGIAA